MQSSARLAPRSVLLLLLGAAVACGGAEASDLFGGTSTTQTDGGADPDSASADDAAGAPGADGGGADGFAGKDSGAQQKDAVAVDTAAPNDDPGISCGQGASGEIHCDPTTQYCCGTASGGSGVNFECKSALATCGGVKIMCDDSADCPGVTPYCCGTFSQNTGYTKVACSMNAACGTPTNNTSYVRFCDPGAATDECTAEGKACTGQSGSLPGYTYCK